MQASTPSSDTSIYLALIGLAGILAVPLTALITFLLSRPKQKAEMLVGQAQAESIRVGTIGTIMGQLETMRTNRDASEDAHRKILRELETELDRARDGEQLQQQISAAKWREIANCYLYMELLEDKAGIPQSARYHKKNREEIIAGTPQLPPYSE